MGWLPAAAPTFADRSDAGRQLASLLGEYADRADVLVLALPRGGVAVGREVARALGAPLHAFIVRKLGAPGNPELAIGALAGDGTVHLDRAILADLRVSERYVAAEIERQSAEVRRRVERYGEAAVVPDVAGRVVLLVDDGVATGSTVAAAMRALRDREPAAIVLAVPVGSPDVLARLGRSADRVVAVQRPDHLFGVGAWYDDFRQVTDEEVLRLLAQGGAASACDCD